MFKKNDELIQYLKEISSERLRDFNKKFIPQEHELIGCTIPQLREIAKSCAREDFDAFASILNTSFEEVMLYGLAIGYADMTLEKRLAELEKFLSLANNWAHIDCAVSTYKFIKKDKDGFLAVIDRYLKSDKPFKVRFALVCLVDYYVEEKHLDYVFNAVENIDCTEYYVSMAAAWLLSICYVKHALSTEKFLQRTKIDSLTFNRAIGKICDSYRVDSSQKEKMKKLKRKI